MTEWIRIDPPQERRHLPEEIMKAGTLLHGPADAWYSEVVVLVGHVNRDSGTCGCCNSDRIYDAYKVLDIDWEDKP